MKCKEARGQFYIKWGKISRAGFIALKTHDPSFKQMIKGTYHLRLVDSIMTRSYAVGASACFILSSLCLDGKADKV